MTATKTTLTPEQFESACDGSIRASRVTTAMLELASTILKSEAARVARLGAHVWYLEPVVDQIEAAIPDCTDRKVQAVLTVAEKFGEDDFGIRADAY